MLHMDRVWYKKCSQTEPNRCLTAEVHDQELDSGPVLTLLQLAAIVGTRKNDAVSERRHISQTVIGVVQSLCCGHWLHVSNLRVIISSNHLCLMLSGSDIHTRRCFRAQVWRDGSSAPARRHRRLPRSHSRG